MYAVELRFVFHELNRAPSPEVMIEGLLRGFTDLRGHVEHIRIRRRPDSFRAVVFATAMSLDEAAMFCGVAGLATAAAIPSVRFAGVRPWPDIDDPDMGAGAGIVR